MADKDICPVPRGKNVICSAIDPLYVRVVREKATLNICYGTDTHKSNIQSMIVNPSKKLSIYYFSKMLITCCYLLTSMNFHVNMY